MGRGGQPAGLCVRHPWPSDDAAAAAASGAEAAAGGWGGAREDEAAVMAGAGAGRKPGGWGLCWRPCCGARTQGRTELDEKA